MSLDCIVNALRTWVLLVCCLLTASTGALCQVSGFVGLKVDLGRDGVLVTGIVEDSPAAKAGFEPNDLILEIDGELVSFDDDVQMIETLRSHFVAGQVVVFEIRRGDRILQKTLVPELDPDAISAQDAWIEATKAGEKVCGPKRSRIDLRQEVGRSLLIRREVNGVLVRWEDSAEAVGPGQLPDHLVESARKQPLDEWWRVTIVSGGDRLKLRIMPVDSESLESASPQSIAADGVSGSHGPEDID